MRDIHSSDIVEKSIKPKILVLDEGFPQTFLLLAALKSAGFDVILAELLFFEDSLLLQYYRKRTVTPDPRTPEYKLFLEQLIKEDWFDLIIANSEGLMPALWELDLKHTSQVYPCLNQLQRSVITDRVTMYQLASSAGLKVINFCILNEAADLKDAFTSLGFPLVMRGRQGFGGSQVLIVNNPSEAHEALTLLTSKSHGTPFAQQYISGYRCLIGGLCESGKVLTFFSQKTLESFPELTGPSIRICSIRDAKLEHYFKALMQALNWDGIACAEFICDGNQEYFFLEVNPRPWAAISASKLCGLDMVKSYADFLAGRKENLNQHFVANKEVILFPAFFSAKATSGQVPTLLLHPIQTMKCLWGAPWREKRLMAYYFVCLCRWLKQGMKRKLTKLLKKLQFMYYKY